VFCTARPAPGLRQLVRYYYQFDIDLHGRTLLQPVPARSPQAIEFTFGTPYIVRRLARGSVERAHPVALIGAQTFRRVDLVMQGKVDAFTIVFQPGGLFRLFSLPGQSVTNDHFEGQSALGRRLGELERRLGDVTCFHDRVRIADDWLCARRPVADAMTHTARAAAEVLSRSGCIRVADLARSAGIGVRQFERRFVHEIGVTPKLYARIARFEAALRRKAATPEMRWTDIAHALEYHDQMHMVHDFNRLSGASPTAIGGQLDMFVQPELASADPSTPSGG
jgi:AraC-like DNA-binding protein